LSTKDQLSIDVDNILPPELFLNDLNIEHKEGLELLIPKRYEKNSAYDK